MNGGESPNKRMELAKPAQATELRSSSALLGALGQMNMTQRVQGPYQCSWASSLVGCYRLGCSKRYLHA